MTCAIERVGDPIADLLAPLRDHGSASVGDRDRREVDADVHADVRVALDVVVEVGGRPATDRGARADPDLVHEAVGEQFVDDRRDRGLGERRALGDLGARDRSGSTNDVEHDRAVVRTHHPAVDLGSRDHASTLVR